MEDTCSLAGKRHTSGIWRRLFKDRNVMVHDVTICTSKQMCTER